MKCEDCDGTGIKLYPNTATYHLDEIIAGQGFTEDTCNVCWGSGDSEKPGKNLLE